MADSVWLMARSKAERGNQEGDRSVLSASCQISVEKQPVSFFPAQFQKQGLAYPCACMTSHERNATIEKG